MSSQNNNRTNLTNNNSKIPTNITNQVEALSVIKQIEAENNQNKVEEEQLDNVMNIEANLDLVDPFGSHLEHDNFLPSAFASQEANATASQAHSIGGLGCDEPSLMSPCSQSTTWMVSGVINLTGKATSDFNDLSPFQTKFDEIAYGSKGSMSPLSTTDDVSAPASPYNSSFYAISSPASSTSVPNQFAQYESDMESDIDDNTEAMAILDGMFPEQSMQSTLDGLDEIMTGIVNQQNLVSQPRMQLLQVPTIEEPSRRFSTVSVISNNDKDDEDFLQGLIDDAPNMVIEIEAQPSPFSSQSIASPASTTADYMPSSPALPRPRMPPLPRVPVRCMSPPPVPAKRPVPRLAPASPRVAVDGSRCLGTRTM